MEIITGVERRRRWRDEDKVRIVAEAEAPGAIFSAVARRHDVSRGQLWNWRRLVRDGVLGGHPGLREFLPVRMLSEPWSNNMDAKPASEAAVEDEPGSRSEASPASCSGRIEIQLANGICILAEGSVDIAALQAAISAAKG